ncbi:hypothetical protein ACFL0M_02935 [Thermodesulfobacteriota bacterium]
MDMKMRKELFATVVILGITLDLAIGFIVGLVMAYALKSERLKV